MDLDSVVAEYRAFKARVEPMLLEWEEAKAKKEAAAAPKPAPEPAPAPETPPAA